MTFMRSLHKARPTPELPPVTNTFLDILYTYLAQVDFMCISLSFLEQQLRYRSILHGSIVYIEWLFSISHPQLEYIHYISMTSLLAHKVAHPTKWRFLPKNLNQLVIFVIGLAFTWSWVDKNRAQFQKTNNFKKWSYHKMVLL